MGNSGRISVLVSDELQTLLSAIRELPAEVDKQIRVQTRLVAEPVWQEVVRANVTNALQTRVLSDTARVSVSDSNVTLRSGGIGRLDSGTPIPLLTSGTEFGANRDFVRTVTNRKGTSFKRHTKRQFRWSRAGGMVVYPAAREIIPRLASLWVQTAVRAVHEMFEKGGAK